MEHKNVMKESMMDNRKILDKHYETIAWGVGFIWTGILGVIPGDQNSIGLLSIGFILLGLNLSRFLSQIPVSGFTVVLGVLACILGAALLLRSVLNFPYFEVDLFPLLLIVFGLYLLIPGQKSVESG